MAKAPSHGSGCVIGVTILNGGFILSDAIINVGYWEEG